MNIFKKLLCTVLVLNILFISSYGAFIDMPYDETERNALNNAVLNGLLNGVSENEIAPYAPITRSQMGAILVRAMGAKREADISKFIDVSPKAWYYKEMSRAVAMGAFQGDGDVNLYPDKSITYQEAFLVLSRIFDLRYVDYSIYEKYPDKDSVASWAKEGVVKVVSGGYYHRDKLNPTSPINRVEFAKIMEKLVVNYIDTPGTYTDLPDGNTLIRCDNVILDSIVNSKARSATEGNLFIIGDSVTSTSVVNADGINLVVRGGNVKLNGKMGIVRTTNPGTSLSVVSGEYSGKVYPDGSKGIIAAPAEGSYINLE